MKWIGHGVFFRNLIEKLWEVAKEEIFENNKYAREGNFVSGQNSLNEAPVSTHQNTTLETVDPWACWWKRQPSTATIFQTAASRRWNMQASKEFLAELKGRFRWPWSTRVQIASKLWQRP
ncbi:hypothetical protein NC652_010070 [Populus alba x Populus x berolinensis]|nr:hypothetical protein NC652_010070 [Populus alba x Populus x berolinensis]